MYFPLYSLYLLDCCTYGAIALSFPPIVIDNSSWKNAAESFTVALTLTLGGYESAIAPYLLGIGEV